MQLVDSARCFVRPGFGDNWVSESRARAIVFVSSRRSSGRAPCHARDRPVRPGDQPRCRPAADVGTRGIMGCRGEAHSRTAEDRFPATDAAGVESASASLDGRWRSACPHVGPDCWLPGSSPGWLLWRPLGLPCGRASGCPRCLCRPGSSCPFPVRRRPSASGLGRASGLQGRGCACRALERSPLGDPAGAGSRAGGAGERVVRECSRLCRGGPERGGPRVGLGADRALEWPAVVDRAPGGPIRAAHRGLVCLTRFVCRRRVPPRWARRAAVERTALVDAVAPFPTGRDRCAVGGQLRHPAGLRGGRLEQLHFARVGPDGGAR